MNKKSSNEKTMEDKNREDRLRADQELAFLSLLYEKPLYEFVEKGERDVNVLVIGWNKESEEFVDQCLSIGQMAKHYLKIFVMTENPNSKDEYFASRPALRNFINIFDMQWNESVLEEELRDNKKNDDMYGNLYFMNISQPIDVESLKLFNSKGKSRYHYFLVSLGDDEINKESAYSIIYKLITNSVQNYAVSYVTKDKISYNGERGAIPVFVPSYVGEIEVDKDLNRMAFNTHILWGSFINMDYQEAFRTFDKPKTNKDDPDAAYFYSSSVAMAASIKYKLADIGIEWGDFNKVARAFEKEKNNPGNKSVINEIIALEHRRWLIEKAVKGWKAPEDPSSPYAKNIEKYYEACIKNRNTKIFEYRIHPCMVRSTATPSISETEYGKNREFWETPEKRYEKDDKKRMKNLDDLDRMSLELHRAMRKAANEYRNSTSNRIKALQDEFKTDQKSTEEEKEHERELNRYLFCFKNILDGNLAYSKQYNDFRDHYLESIKYFDTDRKNDIETDIKELDEKIWPAIQANQYIDYKNYDKALVEGISFILTYRTNFKLALPFKTETQTNKANSVFMNVVSATVIRPQNIYYFIYLNEDRIDDFYETLRNCCDYLRSKNINSEIIVYAAILKGINRSTKVKVSSLTRSLDKVSVKFKTCQDSNGAVKYFEEVLNEIRPDLYESSFSPFNSLEASGKLYDTIKGVYPTFEFDPMSNSFTHCDKECEYLNYIKNNSYLDIKEMFKLAGAEEIHFRYPYKDKPELCNKIWGIYTGKNRRNKESDLNRSIHLWNVMTQAMKNLSDGEISIIEFEKNEEEYREKVKNPDYCLEDLRGLLEELTDKKILQKVNEELICIEPYARDFFQKSGNILETCLYYALCEDGFADDVASGPYFRFRNQEVDNELDLIFTKGFQSVLVECKGTGNVDQNFYHKLTSVVDRVGIGAHKAIVTTARVTDNDKSRGDLLEIKTIEVNEDIHKAVTELENLIKKEK